MWHVRGRGKEWSWLGNPRKRDNFKDLRVDGRKILKWTFKKYDGERGVDWSGSEQGQVKGSCEHSNEPSSSKTCKELDYMKKYCLLN